MVDFLKGSELLSVKEMERRLSSVAKGSNEVSGTVIGSMSSITIDNTNYDVPNAVFHLIECLVKELRELKGEAVNEI